MAGETLELVPEYRECARRLVAATKADVLRHRKFTLSIGGESGAGKSVLARELRRQLEEEGIAAGVLALDDYYIFPARTCHEMRARNIAQVGMYEARLDFVECHLRSFKLGTRDLYKPLSLVRDNRLTTEVLEVEHLRVLIAEGTYATALRFVDCRVFIDRTFEDTLPGRQARGRDILDELMPEILRREHAIVREQRALADIVVSRDLDELTRQRPSPSPWA